MSDWAEVVRIAALAMSAFSFLWSGLFAALWLIMWFRGEKPSEEGERQASDWSVQGLLWFIVSQVIK